MLEIQIEITQTCIAVASGLFIASPLKSSDKILGLLMIVASFSVGYFSPLFIN